MTEPRNIRTLPPSQLTDDELRQRRDELMTEWNAFGEHTHIGDEPVVIRLRGRIDEIESEMSERRNARNAEAMLAVSQGMLDASRATLKVYKVLVWLTVILAVGTIGQVAVAMYQTWPKH